MRLRRISAVFWATCIGVLVFILYVVTDLSFKLPSVKPFQENHETQWTTFEKKLHNIEKELTHHEAVVEEIRSAVNHIVEQSQELDVMKSPNDVSGKRSSQVSSKSPSKLCPIELMGISPVIQMLQLYENSSFLDVDGGAWKQGWNIEYDQRQWDADNKLKVFIVPHSHNDPGWLKTFENYYKTQTKAIFKNMVEKLREGTDRKFIWAETSYLSLWWYSNASDKEKAAFQSLLRSGHIEIVTGGWVMNDEANSHWLSVIQQLTAGHQWLIDHLGYIPKNAWAIDPFGHSSAQPYLLKLAGFENSIIQRVHYIVKKELALQKSLEFRWRQTWDGNGATELFTHMMPFYSYDVPHSCGPDPKVCCQFDFRRLPGFGSNCPWRIAPKKITPKNVDERASLILDQWRKKAQLYKTNVVFFPLGDDFRYDQAYEWDEQYSNYETLINYINSKDEFHAEIQFGTLEDYFKAVHAEVPINKFPIIAGDFFTYADRNQHYWSGYYTTRPFHKSMDRALLAYLRAAEIITGQAVSSQKVTAVVGLQLRDKVVLARQALALFQHHDGITGTSRNEVKEDYALKMLTAIRHCQATIQQAAYYLLDQPKLQEQIHEDIFFEIDDEWLQHSELPKKATIVLDSITARRNLLLYNPLLFRRKELVTFTVSTPNVEILDPTGTSIPIQISPVVGGVKLWFVNDKYHVTFLAKIDAMSISTYVIQKIETLEKNKLASFASLRIYNAPALVDSAPKMFEIEDSGTHKTDISLGLNDVLVTLDETGLIKSVRTPDGTVIPIKMEYVTYTSRKEPDNNSGAYLFIPSGSGTRVPRFVSPELLVLQGDLTTSLHAAVEARDVGNVIVTIKINNNPSLPQTEIEISNTLLLDQSDDVEVAMRFSTDIRNNEVFYTDVNGMQMIKRRHFHKLPIQANYYPLPAAAYIEDKDLRLTLLTSTPLGVASLQDGQIEIMQDRRLSKDDNRGLNQPILDNIWTKHTFKLILEKSTTCRNSLLSSHSGSGFLTLGAHVSQQMLLQPLITMNYATQEQLVPEFKKSNVNAADLILASFNSHILAKTKDERTVNGMGLTFQRVYLTSCYGESAEIETNYPVSNGQFRLSEIADVPSDQIYESTLTYVRIKEPLRQGILNLCPMQIRSVFVNQTLKHT